MRNPDLLPFFERERITEKPAALRDAIDLARIYGTVQEPRRFTDRQARALQHELGIRLKWADVTEPSDRQRMLVVMEKPDDFLLRLVHKLTRGQVFRHRRKLG